MRLLLDTHTLLWTMNASPRLSSGATKVIVDPANQVFVSVVCIWEAATKFRSGKLPEAATLVSNPSKILSSLDLIPLPVELAHAQLGGTLATPHKDPFDRILAAQAILNGLDFVSADAVFDSIFLPTTVARIW